MKISSISVSNVTSYNTEKHFAFENDVNILIGPNGSGKSNIQRIISLVLTNFFIYQYSFQITDEESKLEILKMIEKKELRRTLDKYSGNDGSQTIKIDIIPEKVDIENIESIRANMSNLIDSLDYYESQFSKDMEFYISESDSQKLDIGHPLRYEVTDLELIEPDPASPQGIFLKYLRTFFIYARFAGRIPGMILSSPVFFFFSQRSFRGNVTVKSNQIEDQNYYSGYQTAYKAAIGGDTSILQWGIQHYTKIYYQCMLKASASEGLTAIQLFAKNPDVILLEKYLSNLVFPT